MTKLKFVIFGPETPNTLDLVEEIKKSNNIPYVIQLKNIVFEFKNGKYRALWKNKDLRKFDIFLLRGYNKNLIFAQILIESLLTQNKTVIDETIGKKFLSSKVFEASLMNRNKIRHPRTYQAIDFIIWKKLLTKINFPIIAKPIYGQKGQGIVKLENKKEYLKFFAKNPRGYLVQEFLKIDGDIRVFVVNNKVLGAMKRFIVPGDFRSNASLGAKTEKINPSKEMTELALKAVKTMGYEIAGVDILKYKNKFYVLEVNSSPQWQKFKETTSINPAKEIIRYSLKKYEKIQSRLF
jgi:ribosomal protein S6--L-glutamate ligase